CYRWLDDQKKVPHEGFSFSLCRFYEPTASCACSASLPSSFHPTARPRRARARRASLHVADRAGRLCDHATSQAQDGAEVRADDAQQSLLQKIEDQTEFVAWGQETITHPA